MYTLRTALKVVLPLFLHAYKDGFQDIGKLGRILCDTYIQYSPVDVNSVAELCSYPSIFRTTGGGIDSCICGVSEEYHNATLRYHCMMCRGKYLYSDKSADLRLPFSFHLEYLCDYAERAVIRQHPTLRRVEFSLPHFELILAEYIYETRIRKES